MTVGFNYLASFDKHINMRLFVAMISDRHFRTVYENFRQDLMRTMGLLKKIFFQKDRWMDGAGGRTDEWTYIM